MTDDTQITFRCCSSINLDDHHGPSWLYSVHATFFHTTKILKLQLVLFLIHSSMYFSV